MIYKIENKKKYDIKNQKLKKILYIKSKTKQNMIYKIEN